MSPMHTCAPPLLNMNGAPATKAGGSSCVLPGLIAQHDNHRSRCPGRIARWVWAGDLLEVEDGRACRSAPRSIKGMYTAVPQALIGMVVAQDGPCGVAGPSGTFSDVAEAGVVAAARTASNSPGQTLDLRCLSRCDTALL
jgi:hypothetical protein